MLITKKHFAGEYERTDGRNVVRVYFEDCLGGWIAAAKWDRLRYSDPMSTKQKAIRTADRMLFNAGH